jgi:hypothetical protein
MTDHEQEPPADAFSRHPLQGRRRLPNRRPARTVDLVFCGALYQVTIGYRFDVRTFVSEPAEVFTGGAKPGSEMDAILDDACVTLSLLLQHGVAPAALALSVGRAEGAVPASVIGALADLVAAAPPLRAGEALAS